MTTYIETKIIALTSQSATIKYNGDFLSNVRYNLGSIYNSDADIIHKHAQLLNAQIPYSFYVVNYTNNTLVIKTVGDPVFTTITIPVGNYNANSLISTLVPLFNSVSGIIIQITLSNINGILTFFRPSGGNIIISSQSTCLGILGFTANTTYTSVANTLVAPYPLNLLGIKTLQIRSSNLIMSNISSVQGGQTTLLAAIPVSCVPFGMMDYTDVGNNLISIHNDSLDDLDLDIIDGEGGAYINFNNQDWCITLAIHITRTMEPVQQPTISSISKLAGNQGSPATPPILQETLEKPIETQTTTNKSPALSKYLDELNILSE